MPHRADAFSLPHADFRSRSGASCSSILICVVRQPLFFRELLCDRLVALLAFDIAILAHNPVRIIENEHG